MRQSLDGSTETRRQDEEVLRIRPSRRPAGARRTSRLRTHVLGIFGGVARCVDSARRSSRAVRYTSCTLAHRSLPFSFTPMLLALLVTSAGCAGRVRLSGPAAAGPAITEASVRSHMEFLAGDAMNGRGSGTRDEWIAASYFAAQMRKWGLEPLGDDGGYVKTVNLESFKVVEAAVLTVGDTRFAHGKEMIATAITGAQVTGRLQKSTQGADVGPGAAYSCPSSIRHWQRQRHELR